MKTALLAVTFMLGGCAHADIYGVGWSAHITTVFKDPRLDGLKLVTHTPTTRQYLNVTDYSSTTKITGAEVGAMIGTVGKLIVGIP